jgi:hypothetical protein
MVLVLVLVSHWSQAQDTVASALDQSARNSFASSDISPAIATSLWVHLLPSNNLVDLEHLFKSFHSAIGALQQDNITMMWLLSSYQYVLNH